MKKPAKTGPDITHRFQGSFHWHQYSNKSIEVMENILLKIFEPPICDNHSLIGDSRGGRKKMIIETGYMNFKIWLEDWQSSQLNRQLQRLQGGDAHIMLCTYSQSSWCHLRLPNEEWTRLSVSARRSSPNLRRSDAPWLRVRLKNTKWEFSFLLRVKGNHIGVINISSSSSLSSLSPPPHLHRHCHHYCTTRTLTKLDTL